MQKVEITYYVGSKLINDFMRKADFSPVYEKMECVLTFKNKITADYITEKWKKKIIDAFNKAGAGDGLEYSNFEFKLIEEL